MRTGLLACSAHIRTSTDDQQSPEDSRRWQLDDASRLVATAGGQIVAVYHDIDVTSALPWSRRLATGERPLITRVGMSFPFTALASRQHLPCRQDQTNALSAKAVAAPRTASKSPSARTSNGRRPSSSRRCALNH